jgi:uncharacterized protein YndB with AHSA1/START domain
MASWKQQAMIEAPMDDVWAILADPSRGPDWDEDVLAVTGAPAKIEKGSNFDVTSRGPLGMKGTTTFRVEELEDMHEIRMQCQRYGFYTHWVLTPARGGTFTELEVGIEPQRGIQSRAVAMMHTKGYLRRAVDQTLDGLRRAVARDHAGAS